MPIHAFEGKRPSIARSAYVSPTAMIVGEVSIGERCYVGHGAILRGDYGAIEIGDETAVEEGVIVHARPGDRTRIGKRVTLGHGAMVHNAVILDGAVIGMRAVISDYSEVGEGAIIGEMGLVRNGQKVPPEAVALGQPVRVVGKVGERHELMAKRAKEIYVDLARRYSEDGLVELPPHSPAPQAIGSLIPIGTIHTPFQEPEGTPIQGALAGDAEGEVRLFPAYQRGLADLEGFSHLVLLYAFHRSPGFELEVTPYLDDRPRGLFSTRAPRRPNPIGMTVVRLLGVDGPRLSIRGVDVLDGTPLLDIKPSVPAFDHRSCERCGWLEPHLEEISGGGDAPVADDRFHGEGREES